MKQGELTYASEQPLELEIHNLYSDVYELTATDNVEVVQNDYIDENGETVKADAFKYNFYLSTVQASGYEEIVSALVELKYTHGDEISLMRKGISNDSDEEYLNYLEYVSKCKLVAKRFFGLV